MQSELDALIVVIVDTIWPASVELFKAVKRCKMEVLGPEGAEEALDHRVVKAVWTYSDSTDGLKVSDLLGIFNQIDLGVAVNSKHGLRRHCVIHRHC